MMCSNDYQFHRSVPVSHCVESFCMTLCSSWSLSLNGIAFNTSGSTECGDPLLPYKLQAVLISSDHIEIASLHDVLYNSNTMIKVHDHNIIIRSLSADNDMIVGSILERSLTIDITDAMSFILNGLDIRYCVFDIISVEVKAISGTEFHLTTSQPTSLYPPQYRFDISFWIGADFTIHKFVSLVRAVSSSLIKSLTLIDIYTDPESGRKSHCYTVVYQSLDCALSYDRAYLFFQHLRSNCSEYFDVILR